MHRSLRIIAADDEPFIQEYYQQVLPALGHQVLAVVDSGWELVEKACQLQPDLIITDIKMPDMDGIDAAHKIYWEQPMPVIIVSGFHDPELIERVTAEHILAYLVKPVTMERLQAEIALAMERFDEFQVVLQQTGNLRQALKDRRMVEQAKAILIGGGMNEREAFAKIRDLAVAGAQSMVDAARSLLAVGFAG